MEMTEKEARQKLCPFGVTPVSLDTGMTSCIASDCLGWEWLILSTKPNIEEKEEKEGFCARLKKA